MTERFESEDRRRNMEVVTRTDVADHDIIDVFSRRRVNAVARPLGLRAGYSLDLTAPVQTGSSGMFVVHTIDSSSGGLSGGTGRV